MATRWMALFVLSLILTGCGKPFRVSEQVQSVPGSPTGQATMNRLMVEAHAMTDEDELMQLFNANLILARLLVVRIELGNHGDEPINLRRLRFNLRDAQGRAFRFLKPRKAVQKLYGYYEISTYLIAARKEIEAEFDREALQTESELTQGEQRRGLVYFQFPQEVDNFNPVDNLTVRLERLRWSTSDQKIIVELQLNR